MYSIAYGINEGVLDKDMYLPVMVRGWNALVSAVESNGKGICSKSVLTRRRCPVI